MDNTGLRPDESLRVEFRDVRIVEDEATGQTILEIEVRGKRGIGWCKSMPGAVQPFKRLQTRLRPSRLPKTNMDVRASGPTPWVKPTLTDRLFPASLAQVLNGVLAEEKLKKDREGKPRTAYSWRHTYICFRLIEGADIYQVAKNCRTSVEMIEEHYARHIKNVLDASAINVRKGAIRKERKSKSRIKLQLEDSME